MTTKKQIEELKKEIAELKIKVAMLEARPMFVTINPLPALPAEPFNPQPYPLVPYQPTITCGNLGINKQPNIMM